MSMHAFPASIHQHRKENHNAYAQEERPPPAIQHMLKSSTEFGDLGALAPQPLRLHRSNTQASHRLRASARTSHTQYSHGRRRRRPEPQHGDNREAAYYNHYQPWPARNYQVLMDHRTYNNRSVASMRSNPSPAPQGHRPRQYSHPMFGRVASPASYRQYDGRLSSMTSMSSVAASSTGSLVPHYYDYSESFHGHDIANVQRTPPAPIPETDDGEDEGQDRGPNGKPPAHSPNETQQHNEHKMSAVNQPIELPTNHNRRPSDRSMRTTGQDSSSATAEQIASSSTPSVDNGTTSASTIESDGGTSQSSTNEALQDEDLTIHDKSTVESLLDQHIECLGLGQTQVRPAVTPGLTAQQTSHGIFQDQSSISGCDTSSPFSLLDRHIECLGLRKDIEVSPTVRERSYGWLPLPSEVQFQTGPLISTATLESGDVADDESGATICRAHLQRSSTVCAVTASGSSSAELDNNDELQPPTGTHDRNRRARSESISRKVSQKHRKLKILVKPTLPRPLTSTTDDWNSTEAMSEASGVLMNSAQMLNAPLPIVDGFAELSGESVTQSQQALASEPSHNTGDFPDTWSSIVAAMPMPTRHTSELTRSHSKPSNRSHESIRKPIDPVNSSRQHTRKQSREVKAQTSLPRLSTPAFGPSLRASQFDLSLACKIKAPKHKKSSFSEPPGLLHGDGCNDIHQSNSRKRFGSLRQIMPNSIRSFTFSPRRSFLHCDVVISKSCREQKADSFQEPTYPATVAMSDFAYHKHKLLERIRDWCRRRCAGRRRRGRTSNASGLLL